MGDDYVDTYTFVHLALKIMFLIYTFLKMDWIYWNYETVSYLPEKVI